MVELYTQLYRKTPSEKGERWLQSMAGTYGERRACNALSAEYQKDANPKTILGRMELGLQEGNQRVVAA